MWITDRNPPSPTPEPPNDSAAWLARWTETLAVPRNFWAERRENLAIGDTLAEAFAGWGYDVRFQGAFRNVVALPRARRDEPLVLVGAHYDSVPRCPGADDNASGVAVLLAAARALSRSDAPVGFVAFNAEENGLLGSRDFVDRGLHELAIRPLLAHVLEMVGFRSRVRGSQRLPFPWPTQRFDTADFVAIIGNAAASGALGRVMRSHASPRPRCVSLSQWVAMDSLLPDLRRSDHFPFWTKRIPALLWTDTADLRNPNYHRTSDTPDTLDYGFMAEVANLLVTSLGTMTAMTTQGAPA